MVEYKTNKNIVFCCNYHVVWVTKYRRPVLTEEIQIPLKELLTQIAKEIKVEILEMEVGEMNHVHLAISLDPQYGVHRAVKRFKGATSRYLRQEFPHLTQRLPTLWTNSYFVCTTGGAPLEKIKEYVRNQKRSR
ncbi:transposase IS200-family protein [Stanieria cyanosphaera PCC 7437]|uniref:Transposase IS200-family protein n=1 Tax=Stanieria cyanosphaera (strain ATCC 29371 / PCC 7437) TaxID=111780 RepID=K9XSF7_STAC7|nr:IS200/IS605 family transposase [Stanieria cyanosphaera]AFZ35473.1 transposase IS200-family protein [Stanieria cyanosphaera PCC 7437]